MSGFPTQCKRGKSPKVFHSENRIEARFVLAEAVEAIVVIKQVFQSGGKLYVFCGIEPGTEREGCIARSASGRDALGIATVYIAEAVCATQ